MMVLLPMVNTNDSFKFRQKVTNQTGDGELLKCG